MLTQLITLSILVTIAILPLVIWHHQKPRGQYSIIFKKLLHTKTRYYLLGVVVGLILGYTSMNVLNNYFG